MLALVDAERGCALGGQAEQIPGDRVEQRGGRGVGLRDGGRRRGLRESAGWKEWQSGAGGQRGDGVAAGNLVVEQGAMLRSSGGRQGPLGFDLQAIAVNAGDSHALA